MPTSPSPLEVPPAESLAALLAAHPDGDVSVWLGGLDGAASHVHRQDAPHYAASTMKLPLAVAALRRHERGELDLDQPVPVHDTFASAADGSPFRMDRAEDQDDATWSAVGTAVPLSLLLHRMIVCSGNLATNLVLEHVGQGEVAAVLQDAGCSTESMLPRGIEDATARIAGLDNLVTAADLARILIGTATGTLAGPQSCAAVEALLVAQVHRDAIAAGLPEGTYVAAKPGWVDGVAHEVALVRPEGREPYVLAVCTTTGLEQPQATALVARISTLAWQERLG
jgi:beta-lactamase class A